MVYQTDYILSILIFNEEIVELARHGGYPLVNIYITMENPHDL
jgi:hypothetical protein